MGALFQVFWMTSLQLRFFTILHIYSSERHDGFVPSVLVSRSSSLGMISGWDIMLCSWARHLTLTVPLNLVTAVWTSTPSRGSRSTPSRFVLKKPDLSHLAHMQSLPSPGWFWKILSGSRIWPNYGHGM